MPRPRRISFGSYRPDLPPLVNTGLTRAKNVFPATGGYLPVPSLTTMSLGALTGRARGALSGVTASGVTFHIAGDDTKLYRLTASGLVDASKAGGYHCAGDLRWRMVQYGNVVLAINPADTLQFYTVGNQAPFATVVDGTNSIPRASSMAVVGLHLVVGDYFDAYTGPTPDGIRFSAIGNPLAWPEPATDIASALQSDRQPLSGRGGAVQAITGGEVGGVFQERSIWRMDYRGGETIYELHRVEPDRGLLIPDLAIPFTRSGVFYCAEDGFFVWDYTASMPVGDGVINRTFLADVQSSYFDRVSWSIHPSLPVLLIAYPGQGSVSGAPNKLLAYNWVSNQFSHPELDVELLCQTIPATRTLDDLPAEDLDLGTGSLDDRGVGIGSLAAGAYNGMHELSSFSGAAMVAEWETGDRELFPSARALVTEVRPLVTGGTASARVAVTGRQADEMKFGSEKIQEPDGKCSVRADGRYHRFRVIARDGFDSAVGIEVTASPSGRR